MFSSTSPNAISILVGQDSHVQWEFTPQMTAGNQVLQYWNNELTCSGNVTRKVLHFAA